jgi:ubiquitin-like modifier-activating enzyme ATG7
MRLSIPMPGHADQTPEMLEESVTTLDGLVKSNDVVFLLTDTRESRWLPTVMAAAHDKILINAALGLDSWLVMRHGGGLIDSGDEDGNSESRPATTTRLGCYFCNDVVAPENSTKNRTLDQQCTVTRPGLAPIASSMAVELLVSLLHHPKQQRAPAPVQSSTDFAPGNGGGGGNDDTTSSPLGSIPHQIRGSLVSYTMMNPTVPAFKCCTGCARPVVEAYKSNKLKLVSDACASIDGSFLEDLSGLTSFRAEAADKLAEMEVDWDIDDDDEEREEDEIGDVDDM